MSWLINLLPVIVNTAVMLYLIRQWRLAMDKASLNNMAARALLEYVPHDGIVRRVGTDGVVAKRHEVIPGRVIVSTDKDGRMVEVEIVAAPPAPDNAGTDA